MRKAPLLQEETLSAYLKPASLQDFCGFWNPAHRKRGTLEEPDLPLHDDPHQGKTP